MAQELLRIASQILWREGVIRPGGPGLETELSFEVEGRPFSLTLDSVPERPFWCALPHARSLAVYQISSTERGQMESGRFQVRINDDEDDLDGATATFIASTGEAPGTNRLEVAAENGRLVFEEIGRASCRERVFLSV